MTRLARRLAVEARLARLALKQVGGRFWWALPFAPLLWHVLVATNILISPDAQSVSPGAAQPLLIGTPLAVLAAILGNRIVAGEIERRTLEIAYTVPGGAHRIWTAKLLASAFILVLTLAVLSGVTALLFTSVSGAVLWGSFQGALFALALGMTTGAYLRGEVTGMMASFAVLALAFMTSSTRISPLANVTAWSDLSRDPAEILAWTIQNRIGTLLATAAILAAGFARAEQRERLLS